MSKSFSAISLLYDSPVAAGSAHGEIHIIAAGNSLPCSFSFNIVTSDIFPPAESPPKAI